MKKAGIKHSQKLGMMWKTALGELLKKMLKLFFVPNQSNRSLKEELLKIIMA